MSRRGRPLLSWQLGCSVPAGESGFELAGCPQAPVFRHEVGLGVRSPDLPRDRHLYAWRFLGKGEARAALSAPCDCHGGRGCDCTGT